MSKYSSFKDFQLITESWRKYLAEDDQVDTEEIASAAAELQSSPEGQEVIETALDSPEVQAALEQVVAQLEQQMLQEADYPGRIKTSYTPGQLPRAVPGYPDYSAEDLDAQLHAVGGVSAGFSSVFALESIFVALEGTAAWEALVAVIGPAVAGTAVAGGTMLTATVLGMLAAYLGQKGVVAMAKGLYDLSTRGAGEEPPEIGSSRKRFE